MKDLVYTPDGRPNGLREPDHCQPVPMEEEDGAHGPDYGTVDDPGGVTASTIAKAVVAPAVRNALALSAFQQLCWCALSPSSLPSRPPPQKKHARARRYPAKRPEVNAFRLPRGDAEQAGDEAGWEVMGQWLLGWKSTNVADPDGVYHPLDTAKFVPRVLETIGAMADDHGRGDPAVVARYLKGAAAAFNLARVVLRDEAAKKGMLDSYDTCDAVQVVGEALESAFPFIGGAGDIAWVNMMLMFSNVGDALCDRCNAAKARGPAASDFAIQRAEALAGATEKERADGVMVALYHYLDKPWRPARGGDGHDWGRERRELGAQGVTSHVDAFLGGSGGAMSRAARSGVGAMATLTDPASPSFGP